jgi:hypothetical protein
MVLGPPSVGCKKLRAQMTARNKHPEIKPMTTMANYSYLLFEKIRRFNLALKFTYNFCLDFQHGTLSTLQCLRCNLQEIVCLRVELRG